jgi:DNA polymerase (family 10)
MTNADIAAALTRCAELLEIQHADARRISAYRIAAHSVRTFPGDVAVLARREGRQGLDAALYGVGKSIAAAIEQLVRTGRWAMLERLEGAVSCEEIFMSLPGVGHELASRIHEQLGVETLEALEQAAHDGRLERVEGFGPRRARAVRDALAAVLSRPGHSRTPAPAADAPSVEALLEVDAHYRNLAERGALPLIVPRRFNPRGMISLPILHDEVEGFHVHALFSNSALAHKVKRTHDWVVIHHDRDGLTGQHTVVTEQHGPLEGRRVVRGREIESSEYYASVSPAQSPRPSELQ